MALTKETLRRTKEEIIKNGFTVVSDCYIKWDENHECRKLFSSDDKDLGSHTAMQYYSKKNKCILFVYVLNDNMDDRIFIPELKNSAYGIEGDNIAYEINNDFINSFDYHQVKNYSYKKFTGGIKKSNLIDLIYRKHDYASISTGKNRLERELVVMDIDVNIEDYSDKFELLLQKFKSKNISPTFICKNNDEKKHAQLIWALEKPIQYKEKYTYIEMAKLRNALEPYESGLRQNFLKEFSTILSTWTQDGKKYKNIATYLNNINCDICEMKADTEYTGWRCKNPFAGYQKTDWFHHSVQYLMNGKYYDMDYDAIKKFNKKSYRDKLTKYNFDFLYNTIFDKVYNVELLQEKKNLSEIIKNGKNTDYDDSDWEKRKIDKDTTSLCRNNYVFMTTLIVGGQLLNNNPELRNNKNTFFRKVECKVKYLYRLQNAHFKGVWSGTKTPGVFTESEFQSNFINACEYVYKNHVLRSDINKCAEDGGYTDEQRQYAKITKTWHKWLKVAYIRYAKNKIGLRKRNEIANYIKNNFLTDMSIGYISNKYTTSLLSMNNVEFFLKFNNIRNEFIDSTTNENSKKNYYKIDGWAVDENGIKKHKSNWNEHNEESIAKCITWIDGQISEAENIIDSNYIHSVNVTYTEEEKRMLYEQYILKILCLQNDSTYGELGNSPPE